MAFLNSSLPSLPPRPHVHKLEHCFQTSNLTASASSPKASLYFQNTYRHLGNCEQSHNCFPPNPPPLLISLLHSPRVKSVVSDAFQRLDLKTTMLKQLCKWLVYHLGGFVFGSELFLYLTLYLCVLCCVGGYKWAN